MKLRHWNEESLRLMLKRLEYHKTGCCCTFVKLTDITGVKLYEKEATRDFAHEQQVLAHRWRIGPLAGQKFEITDPVLLQRLMKSHRLRRYEFVDDPTSRDGRTRIEHPLTKVYGYITQVVRVVLVSERDEELLERRMRKHGFSTGDVCSGHNIGKIGKRVVCFDFDPVSMAKG